MRRCEPTRRPTAQVPRYARNDIAARRSLRAVVSVFVLANRHRPVDGGQMHRGRTCAQLDPAVVFVIPRPLRIAAGLRATAHRAVSVGFHDDSRSERRWDPQGHRTILRPRIEAAVPRRSAQPHTDWTVGRVELRSSRSAVDGDRSVRRGCPACPMIPATKSAHSPRVLSPCRRRCAGRSARCACSSPATRPAARAPGSRRPTDHRDHRR